MHCSRVLTIVDSSSINWDSIPTIPQISLSVNLIDSGKLCTICKILCHVVNGANISAIKSSDSRSRLPVIQLTPKP